ncbi:MAG: M16 family metallopeptidase, partial [Maricaulaceae bacterium]
VSFSGGDDYSTVNIRSLTKNLDATVAIAAEKLFQPNFNAEDFGRLKAQTIEGIKQSKKEPTNLAWAIFNRLVYGDNNPIAWSGSGTLATVENTALTDYKTFYNAHYSPKVANIVAVSDLSEGKLSAALAPFAAWDGADVPSVSDKPYPELKGGTLYFINKDGAAQSEIRIGKRALPYDSDGEFYRAGLTNYAIGGAFNSRINLNLREDKGYTYGARAFFDGEETRGAFIAYSGVKKDKTAESIVEFINEMKAYHESGITDEELAFTKAAIGQSDARKYETPRQKLGFLSRMATYNLDKNFVDTQADILANMTKAEIDALAAKHYNVDDMIIVVVGDKANIFDDVKALGYNVVELDADGKVL